MGITEIILVAVSVHDMLRLLHPRFRHATGFLSLIVVYAPTENADTSVKEQFYADHEVAIAQCGKNDLKVILGDFNASQAVAEYRVIQH